MKNEQRGERQRGKTGRMETANREDENEKTNGTNSYMDRAISLIFKGFLNFFEEC